MRQRFRECDWIKASLQRSLIQFITICVRFIYLAKAYITFRGTAVKINHLFKAHRSETEPQLPHLHKEPYIIRSLSNIGPFRTFNTGPLEQQGLLMLDHRVLEKEHEKLGGKGLRNIAFWD